MFQLYGPEQTEWLNCIRAVVAMNDGGPWRFEITGDHEAVADGAMSIDDLTDEFDIEWPEPVSGTIGGFLQRQLGRIPSENEVVQIDGVRLTVMLVEHRRVRQVKIERNVAPPLVDDAPDYATPTQPAK